MVDLTRLSTLLQFLGEPEAGQEAKSDGGDPPPAATEAQRQVEMGYWSCGVAG